MKALAAGLLLAVLASPARAGGVDDLEASADLDDAWCDGRRIGYDEVALMDGDRVFVRTAAARCRGAIATLFLAGAGWGDRLVLRPIARGTFEDLWRGAVGITRLPTCGAGANPSEIVVGVADPGAATSIRCTVGASPLVGALAAALRDAASARPRRGLDDIEPFEDGPIDGGDLILVP